MSSGETRRNATPRVRRFLTWTAVITVISAVTTVRGQAFAAGEDSTAKGTAVEVVQPQQRPLVRTLRMPGTLEPDEQVELLAKTSGYVREVTVDIGSRVSKGDTLVRLDVPEMEDELRRVEAVLKARQAQVKAVRAKVIQAKRMVETARAEVTRNSAAHDLDGLSLARKEKLFEGSAIPQQTLDEARSAHAVTEAQLQIARARVQSAQAEQQAVEADVEVAESEVLVTRASIARLNTLMGYASVRAPFDGVITERKVDRGAFVRSAADGSGTPLLSIAKTDRIRVVLEVPGVDASYVGIGTEVEINLKAIEGDPLPGAVTRTASAVKPRTRTMRVEVDIDNSAGLLTPGMYAQVLLKLESKAQVMMIPSSAIRVRGKETIVLVSTNGVAEVKKVQIGYDDGIWAEILSGLGGSELIITASSEAIVPGATVIPVVSKS